MSKPLAHDNSKPAREQKIEGVSAVDGSLTSHVPYASPIPLAPTIERTS